MSAPLKFDAETRGRAVRMYHDHLADAQCSKLAARRHVGELLGVTRRPCATGLMQPAGERPVPSTGSAPESAEFKRLKWENAELRRANELLGEPVSVFRSGGARSPTFLIVDYIDAHKLRFAGRADLPRAHRARPSCSPESTYYARFATPSSEAELADAYAAHEVFCVFRDQRGLYGCSSCGMRCAGGAATSGGTRWPG